MIRIHCKCLFDITCTGVTGYYKPARIPFIDNARKKITDEGSWNISRNQQRNWETLTQILSLRTQIFDVNNPIKNNEEWTFDFTISDISVFGDNDNPFSILKEDANNIPMLTNIVSNKIDTDMLVTSGPKQNIWFTIDSINKAI